MNHLTRASIAFSFAITAVACGTDEPASDYRRSFEVPGSPERLDADSPDGQLAEYLVRAMARTERDPMVLMALVDVVDSARELLGEESGAGAFGRQTELFDCDTEENETTYAFDCIISGGDVLVSGSFTEEGDLQVGFLHFETPSDGDVTDISWDVTSNDVLVDGFIYAERTSGGLTESVEIVADMITLDENGDPSGGTLTITQVDAEGNTDVRVIEFPLDGGEAN